VFSEPLATCVHALGLVPTTLGETAVVLGAGTIGVLAAQLLRLAGTRLIIASELDEERREIARSVADVVVPPEELLETVAQLTHGGVSLSIDAVGSDGTRRDSLCVLRSAGVALWLGMHDETSTVPAFDLVAREQRVQGSFAYTNPEFERAVGLLESGLVKPAVSSKSFPLRESGDVFRQLLGGATDGFLKAIVSPEEESDGARYG
jgi:threonine dehydrogenase-like Zn-dependent dehydrogenase